MKAFLINLDRRPDRLIRSRWLLRGIRRERVRAVDPESPVPEDLRFSGWTPEKRYVNQFGCKMSSAEASCLFSHYKVWESIAALDSPAIILEDDAMPVATLWFNEYKRILEEFDILYLGYHENNIDKIEMISENLIRPSYPYLTSSYAISPSGARKLIEGISKDRILPVDEFLPIMIGYQPENEIMREIQKAYIGKKMLKAAALKFPVFIQHEFIIEGIGPGVGDGVVYRNTSDIDPIPGSCREVYEP